MADDSFDSWWDWFLGKPSSPEVDINIELNPEQTIKVNPMPANVLADARFVAGLIRVYERGEKPYFNPATGRAYVAEGLDHLGCVTRDLHMRVQFFYVVFIACVSCGGIMTTITSSVYANSRNGKLAICDVCFNKLKLAKTDYRTDSKNTRMIWVARHALDKFDFSKSQVAMD